MVRAKRPTRAEIDLDRLSNNFKHIKVKSGGKKICAVVKADAYGHGLEAIRTLYDKGADYFAVAFLDEGIALREHFPDIPILILGPSEIEQIPEIIKYHLEPTVFTLEFAEELSRKANTHRVPVHIKIDTGMSRIGLPWDDALETIKKINELSGIKLKGIFTHFATADEADKSFMKIQLERFNTVISALENEGISFEIKHCENSAALMEEELEGFQMVRPGIILYGHYPSKEVAKENLKIKPVMRFLSKITYLKELTKGDTVGYGRTYQVKEPMMVATIPVGYADGYSRALSHKGTEVMINGIRCPVLGNICMDQIMVDVTGVDCKIGDDVELFGDSISAEEIASKLGTISYEVTCNVSKRVPRVYLKDNHEKSRINYITKDN